MKFSLEIDCENDAFKPVADDAGEAERYRAALVEVRDILAALAGSLDVMPQPMPQPMPLRDGSIRDTNGNRCGSWTLSDFDDEPAPDETMEDVLARHERELAAFPRAAQAPMARAWRIANDVNAANGLRELTYGEMRDRVWPGFVQNATDTARRPKV